MANLRSVQINMFAPIPRGHKVLVQFLDVKILLFNTTATVIWDMTDDIWYGSRAEVINFARNAQRDSSIKRLESMIGTIRTAMCTGSFGDSSRVRTELHVEVSEILMNHVDPINHVGGATRPLTSLHDEVRASREGIEQRWPSGDRHYIKWDEPFRITLHRQPPGPHQNPTTDVHLRLIQRREGKAHTVALTLALATSPEILNLPPLAEYNSKIQGADAKWVIDTVLYYGKMHGADSGLG